MSAPIPVFAFVPDAELDTALRNAIDRVVSSRHYVLGKEVDAFEHEFSAFCGTKHCIGVANGTDALELALRALGVRRGSRVATVANAGYYTCTALDAIGADPVFVDVDGTLTMSPASLAPVVAGVDAVVVTHLYGRLAAIEQLGALASRHGTPIIEDCAQAHGATRGGRRAGSFGTCGCFSFYPTKNLGALGDGGAIVTSSSELADELRALRQYGWKKKYEVSRAGGRNSRLDEVQAAILRAKLPRLAGWNDERRRIARRYCEGLGRLGLATPQFDDREYVAHLFVVRSPERDALRAALAQEDIATDVHYPIADHRQGVRPASSTPLPMTEATCSEVVTLPCYPGLSNDDVDRVIDAIGRHCRSKR
jgi:dTDP-3-amino-2,3,6-trideoxy-4-keto-D-glucose/dTDP-3-amino-3,4,6-trideoxy-alpha-D-glucose/dTDP-2,6-dideoxy-D-kanosamine transaminase